MEKSKRILMVCLGNICRSPLAEGILQHKLDKTELNASVDSAGTANFHVGQEPDQRSAKSGLKHGVDISNLRGRQFGVDDFDNFDQIYVMDKSNYGNVVSLARNEDDKNKVEMLLNLNNPDSFDEVPDPYFGGEQGFENVYQMLNNACEVIIGRLENEGKLYLIPCGLGGENESLILAPQTVSIANELVEFIVEKEKTARHFLKRIGYEKPLNDLILHSLNKHTIENNLTGYLKSCKNGKDIGLISEAGCPAVADPGAAIVNLAHEAGIQVVPLIGPSSILLALMASGMSGQSFVFHGYIPKDKGERTRFIRRMESDAKSKKQSQIFMETPFRNNQILEEVLSTCSSLTKLCIASNISTSGERIITKTVQDWKESQIDLHKKPTVFVLY